MERLTERDGRTVIYNGPGRVYETRFMASEMSPYQIGLVLKRLFEYEETGLKPEEIAALCSMDRRAKMAEMLRREERQALHHRGGAPQKNGWISVEDRLPENDKRVLVLARIDPYNPQKTRDLRGIATYAPDVGWILESFPLMENFGVTYWMPLPDFPEESEHD